MTDQSRPQDQDQEVVQVAEPSGRGRCPLHQTNFHGKIFLYFSFNSVWTFFPLFSGILLLFYYSSSTINFTNTLSETEARGPRNRPRSPGQTNEAD